MTRSRIGEQAACRYCGQDIEFHGRKHGWVDRGNNRKCCAYKNRDGEIVQPNTKHAPQTWSSLRDPGPQPNAEQTAALQSFKEKYGRNWKLLLSDKWLDGSDANEHNGHLLRQVRNQCGPSWLANCKL